MGDWTFFSNYGHVLVCLARNGNVRLRDVAADVGITERAVQKIVKDLQAEGFLTVRKQGRCNRYRINRRKTLRHALESHCTVGKLLTLLATGRDEETCSVEDETVKAKAVPSPVQAREPDPPAVPAVDIEQEPSAEVDVEPESTAEPEPEPKQQRKSKQKDAPLDVEQQGSLF